MLVPASALASGWVPFVIVLVLAFAFSGSYVLWYRSVISSEQSCFATFVSILALAITLLTSTLVPVDVFLVSLMKFPNGTYKDWAEDAGARKGIEDSVLYAYYTFYAIILFFAFFLLPMVFFFQMGSNNADEEDLAAETTGKRVCRAVKYTAVCVLFFAVLILIGIFVPFGKVQPPNDTSQWEKIKFRFEELEMEHGENLIVFLLNVLNVIGMVLLIFYTGYGMSSLPIGMIKGQRSVRTERISVQNEINELEEQIRTIQDRFQGREDSMPRFEAGQMDRLEQQLRLLRRAHHNLDQNSRSCLNRIIVCCRPFQVVFGVLFALFGLLIFTSLLLTSIDKAINSLGPTHGYVLQNGTLPNPIDIILVYAQDIFPLDYILYSIMILFFVFCSMSGVKNIGIRVFCFSVYKIRASRTKPQALILMCVNLIFIILALNVLMFSVVPDYTTYGSQHFRINVTVGNVTTEVVEKCDDVEAPETQCIMSRIAYLLLAFHSKAWIFGAIYYWFIWVFLVVVLLGSFVAIYRARKYRLVGEEEDEEDLLDDSNPFGNETAT